MNKKMDLGSLSDEEIMELYQAGDFSAFETLYCRHAGRVFEYLKKKVSVESAQDLLQEIFEYRIHEYGSANGLYKSMGGRDRS